MDFTNLGFYPEKQQIACRPLIRAGTNPGVADLTLLECAKVLQLYENSCCAIIELNISPGASGKCKWIKLNSKNTNLWGCWIAE